MAPTGLLEQVECLDCPDGGRVVEVEVDWPLLHETRPADRPTGALWCSVCSRFLGWVA